MLRGRDIEEIGRGLVAGIIQFFVIGIVVAAILGGAVVWWVMH